MPGASRRIDSEAVALYHDLLINVTGFFRDPEVFDALKTIVFPGIIRESQPIAPIRVWVPGCSTGQEAYSIAMSLVEFFDGRPIRPPMQIFATDLERPSFAGESTRRHLSGKHRGRSHPRTVAALLCERGPRLPDRQGDSRSGGIRAPERRCRPAFFACRSDQLP